MEKVRILLAEDEPITGMDVKKTLQNLGYDVPEVVSSGEDAVKKVEELKPDLILMGITLSGEMDGIDTVKKIHEGFDIPVIYITAHPEGIPFERAMETDPYGYLAKSAGKDDYCNIIETALKRHEIERRLCESEALLQSIYRAAPSGIGIVKDRVFGWTNSKIHNMTGYTEEELKGKNARILYPTDEEYDSIGREKYAQISEYGTGSVETRWKRKDGTVIDILLSSTAINRDLKEGVVFTAIDITRRKKAEEKIKASLKEKEILLKEIHHRVKNNFQVIISLLALQANTIDNEELLKIFSVSQDRIKAMSLVHERLYRSDDLASIEFDEYIQIIATELFQAYLHDKDRVKLQIETDKVLLNIDQAIPSGLIINELVSNAIKHAFPPELKRKGSINITLKQRSDDIIELMVSDNGIGIPENIDIQKTESLGLKLVTVLTKQLDGELKIDSQKGTRFTIRFQNRY